MGDGRVAAQRTLDQLELVLDKVSDPVLLLDDRCAVLWANRSFADLVDRKIGTDALLTALTPQSREPFRAKVMSGRTERPTRVCIRTATGRDVPFSILLLRLAPASYAAVLRCPSQAVAAADPSRDRVHTLETTLETIASALVDAGIGRRQVDHREILPDRLSPRQREVVELLLHGLTERDVAELLYISLHTVRNHKKAAFRHLDVHSQAELLFRYRPSAASSSADASAAG